MDFQKKVLLKNYTTFRIGGWSRYFFVAKSKDEIVNAIKRAKNMKLPFFVLGGGSNLLISDRDFRGLTVKIQNTKHRIQNTKIVAEAGIKSGQLINAAAKNGLSGLEWLAGIPGTLGGAVAGNAGAFGKSMKDIVKKVEVLDARDFKIKTYSPKKCKFSYRSSVFKHNKNLIVLSATLQLKRGRKAKIKEKIKEYLNYKKETQSLNCSSAGSIFKNPKNSLAWKLIEECGLKGKKIGKAKISEKHANFIVNLGGAKAADVKKLINLVKKEVKKKHKINLKEEIEIFN